MMNPRLHREVRRRNNLLSTNKKMARIKPNQSPKPLPNLPHAYEQFITVFGNIGDFIISIAASLSLGKIKIVAFCDPGYYKTMLKFAECFSIPVVFAKSHEEYSHYCNHYNCRSLCHVPVQRNYNDWWVNWQQYTHISKYYSFSNLFEKIELNQPIITIQPASTPPRCLNIQDFYEFAAKYLPTHHIFAIGHPEQRAMYYVRNPYFHWLTFDKEYCMDSITENNIKRTLSIIGSSEEIFGVDSWLKTYGYYTGIPTTSFSGHNDVFTDRRIWPQLQLNNIRDVINRSIVIKKTIKSI